MVVAVVGERCKCVCQFVCYFKADSGVALVVVVVVVVVVA